GPGGHHYGPRDVQRRSSFHGFGYDGAGRDALPSGQAQRQDGATAGAAEVPLPDRAGVPHVILSEAKDLYVHASFARSFAALRMTDYSSVTVRNRSWPCRPTWS